MGEGTDIGVEGVPGGKLMLGGDCALEALVGGAVAACLEDAVVKRATVRGEGGGVSGGGGSVHASTKASALGTRPRGRLGATRAAKRWAPGPASKAPGPKRPSRTSKAPAATAPSREVRYRHRPQRPRQSTQARDIGDRGESGALAEAKAVHAGGEADAAAGDGIVEASGIAKGGGGGEAVMTAASRSRRRAYASVTAGGRWRRKKSKRCWAA
eukprot:scaffold12794_cov125-Isochrysis_galbana.AAC.4